MQRIFNTIVLLLIFAVPIFAQDALYLSLDGLIARTKKENLSIKKGQFNLELANAELQKSKEWWFPNVFLGTNFHHLNGRALNSDGRFFADVDRQSRWYGGEVNIDLNIGKGIYNSRAKRFQVEQARMQNEVAGNTILLHTISIYYELLKISAKKKLYEELKSSKESLIQQLETQVNIGLKLESDLLLAKSKASRLNVTILELNQQFQHAMANMALALNISDVSNIYVDSNDLEKIDLIKSNDFGELQISNHPLYKAVEFKIEAEHNVAKGIARGILIPQVGARYSYGPFGFDYGDNQLTRGFQAYLGWNVPIGQLVYGGDSKISKSKSKINQLDRQIRKETLSQRIVEYQSQLRDAKDMIILTEEGKDFARQALDQSNQRQIEGLGNLYEVLLAEEEFKKTQLQYIDAVVKYNMIQYMMWDAMGNRF